MGFRFRKSVKLAPGLRMNFSKSSVSATAGRKGASVNFGSRGVYGNVGIPGSGLSYRTKLGGSSKSSRSHRSGGSIEATVQLSLDDNGKVKISDTDGNPLPRKYIKAVKEQQGAVFQKWLEEQCKSWNKGIDAILNLHLGTPAPNQQRQFQREPFSVPSPVEPTPASIGIIGRIFSSRREKIEQRNAKAQASYQRALQEWKAQQAQHGKAENQRKTFHERAQAADSEAMQAVLEQVFAGLDWPRETIVSFQITGNGEQVFIDVDLPEIEDMPTHHATVAARGFKLNIKERSATQRRKEYMAHVHAIGFRLAGETFAVFPLVGEVVLSGYSQRPDKATGQINDEYLYSVQIPRSNWSRIHFDNLAELDLPICFEQFELRRKMTKTGIFRAIEPFVDNTYESPTTSKND